MFSLRLFGHRAVATARPVPLVRLRTFAAASVSGYGDPPQTGDAQSNNPLEQGGHERNQTEHPGPDPVEEGKGGNAHMAAESMTGNGHKPQPKINPQQQPGGKGDAGVEQHNREMDQRYGKAQKGKDQKVGKEYWSETSGRDREP